ncbi:hypothetical protein Ppa06_00190 [Planomonospora parontospora subsp. parontospora]|uniref:Uncharacterized protein n=2 Tax=Planomonospora parontospora TaxID=58119 RepID=A0AA37F1I5_9ACTN|nr:DUF6703 family protein [Planomonospora parontospora]GGK44561.1 hypothetical protein GCM10010126_00190 [Planomonospora parontospora]GII06221.1 hypothetical protein Ppa06_00190 [Planomonospora parontospora subsp. parontospora]
MADKSSSSERPGSGRPAHPLARRAASGRTTGPGRPAARRPLPPGEQFFTPDATGLRQKVERFSAAPLVFLFQLPRWVPPLLLVVLLLAGFAVPSFWGGLAVLPVIAFVGWLAYMSWPSLAIKGRILRIALLTFLLLLAADRFGAF